MARAPNLPFLPGYSFDPNIGRTNFRIDPKFDFTAGVPCLVEKVKPNMYGPLSDRYPSVYARGEVIELPSWIAFDKQILCFEAFFKQSLEEFPNAPYVVRDVKIFFFLEDGTIQIIEKTKDNSGMTQGTLLSRQRVRLPPPMDDNFIDILDLNIGREVEIYGKIFKLTECDKFTRNFLNRQGIAVPDPINMPADPYLEYRKKVSVAMLPKKPNRKVDTFGQFLKNDRKILRFYGYWDDRSSEFGEFHDLEIYYYLADDTIEIKDIIPSNAGRDPGSLLMRRQKLPKVYKGLAQPGLEQPLTVLNVLGTGTGASASRFLTDALDCGKEDIEYYKDRDLSIGGILNVFGRNVVLTDADAKTKEYYRDTYGVSSFVPMAKPVAPPENVKKVRERELPPWNGFGSYEDSAQNCVTVELVPPLKDFKKFLHYDRKGMDSQILRFAARMISRNSADCDRHFMICYYQSDDTIQVVEFPREGKGVTRTFFAREEVFLPGQDMYTSEKPKIYKPEHLFIGAHIVINSFHFIIVDADEYALRYMELNSRRFPKSDINLIVTKLRDKLKPIYKDFVGEMIPKETKAISYEELRNKLCPIMGDDFTEHEMITIARRFSLDCVKERLNKDAIRAITLTEMKRQLWDDLPRLKEYFRLRDPTRTGYVTRQEAWTLLRGCRLPVDVQLLEKILDVVDQDKDGKINYLDLFDFLDRTKCPMSDTIPINVKSELWWASMKEPEAGKQIDWCDFNKELDLEYIFTEKPKQSNLVTPKNDS